MNLQKLGTMIVFLGVALVVCPGTSLSTAAGDGRIEKLNKLGQKIGQTGREIGREVADEAKQVWYKGLRVSEPLLKDVQRQTRRFWAEVIEGKKRTLKKLELENRRLKRRLAEQEAL